MQRAPTLCGASLAVVTRLSWIFSVSPSTTTEPPRRLDEPYRDRSAEIPQVLAEHDRGGGRRHA
jgi:hypothetical protein